VKVYLDTGVFIDYLIGSRHTHSDLRSTDRRGRAPARLGADAETCLSAIRKRHVGITSAITCYEAEEAMYGQLARSASGREDKDKFVIPAARAVITQILVTADRFRIALVDLTRSVVRSQSGNLELQERGIRAADALHVATALAEGAEMFITTDAKLIGLDEVFSTPAGLRLRCVDTDGAIRLLG